MKYLNVSKNVIFLGIAIFLIYTCGCEKINTMGPSGSVGDDEFCFGSGERRISGRMSR